MWAKGCQFDLKSASLTEDDPWLRASGKFLESDDVLVQKAYEVDKQHHWRPHQGQSDEPAHPLRPSEGL